VPTYPICATKFSLNWCCTLKFHSRMRGIMRFGPVVFTGPLMLRASPTGRVVGNPVEINCPADGTTPEL
jgi:hypothetical protein